MKKLVHILFVSTAIIALSACKETNPDLQGTIPLTQKPEEIQSTKVTSTKFFPLVPSEAEFQQSEELTNETTVLAQVIRTGAGVLQPLKKSDFVVTENGQEVKDFDFTMQGQTAEQVVDIAFVVDVTRSMGPFIESAKSVLTNFVKTSREKKKMHVRMCVSTFGDYTVQKCARFYDSNATSPEALAATEADTKELISELTKMHAAVGNEDPGGNDKEENPMGALIDAAAAPWRADAQKFVILVTDAAFLYSPGKQGTIGDKAPTMLQVDSAIDSSQVVVMAVTPSVAGYDSTFQDQPDIVKKSNGEHFLFTSVMKGKISLNDILDRIMSRVNATYQFTYKVNDTANTNLDPSLAMKDRDIKVALKDSAVGSIEGTKASATFPDGRPKYTSQWTLANKTVDSKDAVVTINGEPAAIPYKISGKTITFTDKNKLPPASSKVHVTFYYADNYSNLRFEPIALSSKLREQNLTVSLNGIKARDGDVTITRDMNGNITVTLNRSVAADNYYKIPEHDGIAVKVE